MLKAYEVEHDDVGIMDKPDISGKNISVIGAARSGVAVAELLAKHGANVFVSDKSPRDKIAAQVDELTAAGIEIETGYHTDRVLDADIIVLSPGVPSSIDIVRKARSQGIKIVAEIEIASWFNSAPMIAVTGTNGKTTTTTLLGRLLDDGRKHAVVAGNIGTAFSSVVDEMNEGSIAVLEVSSFQLDDIETFHPLVSIILNITPDHLDRYEHSFEKYIASKCRVFENQTLSDHLIYNDDDPATRDAVNRYAASHVQTLPFSIHHEYETGAFVKNGTLVTSLHRMPAEIIDVEQISIKGVHNLYNSMAAVLAAQITGVSIPSIRATLKNFKGVEHRLEFVREIHGVKYVNDSKATNVDSVWYALQSFREPIVLLLGGRDKGNDYSKLFDLVKRHVKKIIAIGESARKVEQAFQAICAVSVSKSMKEAVLAASSNASTGDVVLLSPACASFDWFENYEHRGRVFKEIVNGL